MYYVYILYSRIKRQRYIGYTDDLRRRIDEHNSGKTKSTILGKPWKLIYYQGFLSKTDARREELFLKSGKGRERLQYLLQDTMKHGEVA